MTSVSAGHMGPSGRIQESQGKKKRVSAVYHALGYRLVESVFPTAGLFLFNFYNIIDSCRESNDISDKYDPQFFFSNNLKVSSRSRLEMIEGDSTSIPDWELRLQKNSQRGCVESDGISRRREVGGVSKYQENNADLIVHIRVHAHSPWPPCWLVSSFLATVDVELPEKLPFVFVVNGDSRQRQWSVTSLEVSPAEMDATNLAKTKN